MVGGFKHSCCGGDGSRQHRHDGSGGGGGRRLGLGQCALRTPSCGCGGGHDDDELERRAQFQQRGRWGIQDSAVWAASAGPATAAVADSKHTRRELGHFVLPTRLQQRRQRPTAHTEMLTTHCRDRGYSIIISIYGGVGTALATAQEVACEGKFASADSEFRSHALLQAEGTEMVETDSDNTLTLENRGLAAPAGY